MSSALKYTASSVRLVLVEQVSEQTTPRRKLLLIAGDGREEGEEGEGIGEEEEVKKKWQQLEKPPPTTLVQLKYQFLSFSIGPLILLAQYKLFVERCKVVLDCAM